MGSLSGVGIGLSFIFGCVLMGLVAAELYYLLWWRKRPSTSDSDGEIEQFSSLSCWRNPSSFRRTCSSPELTNSARKPQEQQDLEMGCSKDVGLKGEEGVEAELKRAHNLCGPPRFLFTIKEESREDLESDAGKSRRSSRTRSLGDLVFGVDGSPLSSPTFKTPHTLDSYNHHGINPLFETLCEAELERLRSSPPPKFKFLKDAEDKLLTRLLAQEAERNRGVKDDDSVNCQNPKVVSQEEGKSASFVSFMNRSLVRDQLHNQASAQVLPLASSPTYQASA